MLSDLLSSADDYKFELSEYAREHDLPEAKYVSSIFVEKNRVVGYFSKVQVGGRSWVVYPNCYR